MTTSRAPPAAAARLARAETDARSRDDQHQRRQPQQQQRPVANAPPLHRLIRNPPQEHQRRKLDDVLPLALSQVDQNRNRQRGQRRRKRAGARNDIYCDPRQSLARRQVAEQRVVERRRGVQQRVVDRAARPNLRRQRRRCAPGSARDIVRASASGTTGICSPLSRSSKLDASVNRSRSPPDRARGRGSGRCRGTESARPRRKSPPALRRDPKSRRRCRGGRSARRASAAAARDGPGARPRPIQRVQHDVEVLGRRRHVLDDVFVERDEADAVALLVHEIGQAGGQRLRVIELRDPRLPKAIDFDTSSSTEKFALESASNSLTKYRSVRANSRQSTRRMSSPGT